jgi:hypothetical protein
MGGGEAEVVKIECVCFYLGNCTLCLPLPPPETLTVKAALYLIYYIYIYVTH